MSKQLRCPECSSLLPTVSMAGICPACLLKGFLGTNDSAPQEPSEGPPLPLKQLRAPAATDLRKRKGDRPDESGIPASFSNIQILDLLGEGGMGRVFRAWQPHLERTVALKIMRGDLASNPEFAERFLREARTLARLTHPNIVTVYDFGRSDDMLFLIMEYVDGTNIRTLLADGPLGPKESVDIVQQVCSALQFAHDNGIIHRDIKPENILIDRHGRVKIADFGLAKLIKSKSRTEALTVTGQRMGTPFYMAPEQLDGTKKIDHRADIYSLGVVFYEMLTGELPIGLFDRPSSHVRIDSRLDSIVLRALEKHPDRRFQNASEISTAVDHLNATTPDVDPNTFRLRCPSCGQKIRLQGNVSKRKTVRCPKCGNPVAISAEEVPRTTPYSAIPWLWLGGMIAVLVVSLGAIAGVWIVRRSLAEHQQQLALELPVAPQQGPVAPQQGPVAPQQRPRPDVRQELAPDKLAPVTPIDPESIEVVGPADGGRPERPIDNVGEMGLPVLRYSFDRGRVPSYQVKLTGDFEDHQEIHSGSLLLPVESQDPQSTTMQVQGHLFGRNEPKPGDFGRDRHFPRMMMVPPSDHSRFTGTSTITVDSRGRILNATDESSLPFFLGTLPSLVLIPFPEEAASHWKTQDRISLTQVEQEGPGIAPWNRQTLIVPASRETTYSAQRADAQSVFVKTTLTIRSEEGTAERPRFEISGKGSFTLDLSLGFMRSVALEYVLTENSTNVTRRIPVTVNVSLQEPKDEKQPVPKPPEELTEADVDPLLEKLHSLNEGIVRDTANTLASTPAGPRRQEIAVALAALLTSEDSFTRHSAARALEKWHVPDNVETLLGALGDESFVVRHAAIRILGEYPSKAAAEAVANCLLEDRSEAEKTLKKMKPFTEPVVRKLVVHLDPGVRSAACEILKEVGTKASMNDLQKAMRDPSLSVRMNAENAVQEILRRGD